MTGGEDASEAPHSLAELAGSPTASPEAIRLPGYLVGHAARVFNRRMETALRPHGLSMTLLVPLLLVRRLGPTTQRDLVRSSPVAQPAMVAALDKLEIQGFVARAPDATDGRVTRIVLTASGARMAAVGHDELRCANALGLRSFSAADTELLTCLLERLILNFEAPQP